MTQEIVLKLTIDVDSDDPISAAEVAAHVIGNLEGDTIHRSFLHDAVLDAVIVDVLSPVAEGGAVDDS